MRQVMTIRTVAIQSPGDMGNGVGIALQAAGFRVITALEGRSERTRGLAAAAKIEDVGTLRSLVAEADLILSILPPSAAVTLAAELADAARAAGATPTIADCNAISPASAAKVGAHIQSAGCPFIDAGIIGLAPGKSDLPTRFYCSGPDTSALEAIACDGIAVKPLDDAIGTASAMKMVYASITKGTMTLHAAALTAAESFGLSEAFHAELASSQGAAWNAMNRMTPRLPLDAGRWVGEMHEISATYGEAGLPTGFHEAAAEMFETLDTTPIAAETRETVDPTRTLTDALTMYVDAVRARK